jgi:hypothetical protein
MQRIQLFISGLALLLNACMSAPISAPTAQPESPPTAIPVVQQVPTASHVALTATEIPRPTVTATIPVLSPTPLLAAEWGARYSTY